MAEKKRRLVVEILGNAKGASDEIGRFGSKTDEVADRMTRWGGVALAAGTAVAGGLAFAAMEYEGAEKQSRKLDNSIANSTQTFTRNGDALRDLAAETQKKTAADADDIVGMQSRLVQFGLQEQQIAALTPLIVDLSRKMGVDLDTAGKAVTKAMDGSSGGLSRMGIAIDETKLKTDPFQATIEALSSSVGGFAEEEGQTFSGQLERLKNQLGDLTEGVGAGAISVIGGLADAASEAAGRLSEIDPAIPEAGGKIAAIGAAASILVGGLSMATGKAIEMRDRFTDVVRVGDTTTRTLNNVGKAAAGLGALGAAVAVYELGKALESATDDALGLETAMKDLDVAETPREVAKAFQDAAASAEGFVSKARDFAGPLLGGDPTIEIEGLRFEIDNLNNALESVKASGDDGRLRKTIDLLRDGGPEVAAALDIAGIKLSDYEAYLDSSAKAADKAASESGELTGAVDEQGNVIDETANAWTEYADAIRATSDPIFAAINATDGLEQAKRDVMSATKDVLDLEKMGAKGTDEYRDAVVRMNDANAAQVRAAFDAENAIAGLAAGVAEGKISYDNMNATLDSFVARGMISAEQANRTREKVAGVHWQVGVLDGQRANVSVTADTSAAVKSLQAFSRLLDGWFPESWNIPSFGGSIAGKAAGGPVKAGTPYIVGEEGPELIIPSANGTVIPAGQTAAMMRGAGGRTLGGGGNTYNFYGPITSDMKRWIVDQLESSAREGVQMPNLRAALVGSG